MKFKQTITGIEYAQGIKVQWWLGYTYQPFDRDCTVYHVVPLNFIIRFFRHVGWLWTRITKKPSKIDLYIHKEYCEAYNRAYNECYANFESKVENRAKLMLEIYLHDKRTKQ